MAACLDQFGSFSIVDGVACTHIGQEDRVGRPVSNVWDVTYRSTQSNLDILQGSLQDRVDDVIPREVDESVRTAELESVQDVWTIIHSSALWLGQHVSSCESIE